MKWWIRTGVLLLGMTIGFCKMPVIKVGSGDRVSRSIRYVALGDSIASGYGLSVPETDSYVGLVGSYLEENYDYVFKANLGTNGLRSDQLLDILTDPENEKYKKYHATLENADIVTLSIGSNDLLHLVSLNRDLQDYIEEGDQMFREACREFDDHFPKIIQEIHKISPNAEIYANNVYNPCGDISGFGNIYDLTEHYVELLNKSFSEPEEYTLVDIKEEFDESEESLLNMAISGKELDPHPNKEGHAKIGSKVIQAITDGGNGEK